MKSGCHIRKELDGSIALVATLYAEDYPNLDAFDRALVAAPVTQPADMIQSMEVLMRRAFEQSISDPHKGEEK